MTDNAQKTVLDIEAEKVAAVYAKALLGAAQTVGQVDEILDELESVVREAIEPNQRFAELLGGEQISHEERVGLLDRVFGKSVSETLLAFLKVISAHQRLGCLAAISKRLRELVDDLNGIVQVTVRTPGAVDDALRDEIAKELASVLGGRPEIHVINDPSLLGGVVVRVGDTIYDGSVATRLAQMRTKMIDRTVEEIETRREAFLTK